MQATIYSSHIDHHLANAAPIFTLRKARGRGAMARTHGLHGLPLPAIGRAPQRPIIARTDGVAAIPEFGGNPAVAGIFQACRVFLPPLISQAISVGKLKMVALVVDGPGTVRLHQNGIVCLGDRVA